LLKRVTHVAARHCHCMLDLCCGVSQVCCRCVAGVLQVCCRCVTHVAACRCRCTCRRTLFVAHCNTLQHAATHYATLQHTHISIVRLLAHARTRTRRDLFTHSASHCTTLHRPAPHCITLHHTATYHTTLQRTQAPVVRAPAHANPHTCCNLSTHYESHNNTLRHTATHCTALHHTAPCCITPHHTAAHSSTCRA